MKKNIFIALLLAVSFGASAQNLNPTVEVTNTYKREASGIEKPAQILPLPDSISRFDYSFDYSVQSTPYRGSYEFKPYNVRMSPEERTMAENRFFGRVGLGYTFHPEASLVWTPIRKANMHLNIYGNYKSYIGKYKDIQYVSGKFQGTGALASPWKDSAADAGANFRMDWKNGALNAGMGYNRIAGTDLWSSTVNNILLANASASGILMGKFGYKASEQFEYTSNPAVKELHSKLSLGASVNAWKGIASLDASLESLDFNAGSATGFEIIPSYSFSFGPFSVKAGVKLFFVSRSSDTFMAHKVAPIYPDVHISYSAVKDYLVLVADVTGGSRLNSFAAQSRVNHFLGSFAFAPDFTTENIRASIGAKGNFRRRLSYSLSAGYYHLENAFSWGYSVAGAGYTPLVGYMCPLNSFFGELGLMWKSEHIDINSQVVLQHTLTPQITDPSQANLFGPPSFRVNLSARYHYFGRFTSGLTLDARSDCPSVNAKLPGYADLGILQEFRLNRYWCFWGKCGNILGQSIQRIPFHAEHGIYFTLGANLVF